MVKAPKEENTKIAVTLPKSALEEIKDIAEEKGLAVSALMRTVVLEYLKENKK